MLDDSERVVVMRVRARSYSDNESEGENDSESEGENDNESDGENNNNNKYSH